MKMKRIKIILVLLILTVLLSSGCTQRVLTPDENGEVSIEMLNVEIIFDLNTQTIYVFNKNWNGAHVKVERLSDYGWGDDPWLDIINIGIGGRGSFQTTAYFKRGDQICVQVKVESQTDQLIFILR